MLHIIEYMNLCFTQKFLNVLRTKKAVFDLKSHLPLFLYLFNVYPIGLFVPCEESPNIKRFDKVILFDVAISIFSHIQVSGISTLLTALQSKISQCHGIIRLQYERSVFIFV